MPIAFTEKKQLISLLQTFNTVPPDSGQKNCVWKFLDFFFSYQVSWLLSYHSSSSLWLNIFLVKRFLWWKMFFFLLCKVILISHEKWFLLGCKLFKLFWCFFSVTVSCWTLCVVNKILNWKRWINRRRPHSHNLTAAIPIIYSTFYSTPFISCVFFLHIKLDEKVVLNVLRLFLS